MDKDLIRHFEILRVHYENEEQAAKNKLAHLRATKINVEHQIQQECQHEDDGGMFYGTCVRCGAHLG